MNKCICGRQLPLLATPGIPVHCSCGLTHSVEVDVVGLRQLVLDQGNEIDRLRLRLDILVAERRLSLPHPAEVWGLWVHDYDRGKPGWLQGPGIPGHAYTQGSEAEMRAEVERRGGPLSRCEARVLPPELAAELYRGGP